MKTRNKYYNPNPFKNETSDCVARAMTKAMDKDWDTVYYELVQLGFELKAMPNSDETWKEYLKRNNFKHHKISVKKGTKRGTVNEFAKKNKEGTFVLSVANHLVTVKDGYYYDTWDCGDKSLYGYYEKIN